MPIKFKKHTQFITSVYYIIYQNVQIFRGFINHRLYFGWFSKKCLSFFSTGIAKMLTQVLVYKVMS